MKEACDKRVMSMQERISSLEKQLAVSQAKVASAEQLRQQKTAQQKEEAEKLRKANVNEKMAELEKLFDKMVEDASDKARNLFKEEWNTMLMDAQSDDTYIVNHHLVGDDRYRYQEAKDARGTPVPLLVSFW